MLSKLIKNIPGRAKKAMGYSLDGLGAAFRKEEAIRLECLSLVLLLVIMFFVPWPVWKKAVLTAVFLLVPLTELLNSALEDLCDLISPEYNPVIKNIKDKGSAAVLVAMIIGLLALAGLIWLP
jgi:diacylglycerol kinase (ATP)